MKIDWKAMREFGNTQLAHEGDPNNVVSFEFKGQTIVNPFFDEDGVNEVNPAEHYGKAFTESRFVEMFKVEDNEHIITCVRCGKIFKSNLEDDLYCDTCQEIVDYIAEYGEFCNEEE